MGFDSLLEAIQEDARTTHDASDKDEDDDSDEDYEKKDDSAVDFSDITELAEDLQTTMQATKVESGDDYDDVEDAIPATKVSVDNVASAKETDKDKPTASSSDGETKEADNDKELMPPPTLPLKSVNSNAESVKTEITETSESKSEKKLETPLAAMLPSKYANVDVRELFPDFRPDKVLRFSRLFGPGKPSSLPQIWRSVRRKRRRRKHSRDTKVIWIYYSQCRRGKIYVRNVIHIASWRIRFDEWNRRTPWARMPRLHNALWPRAREGGNRQGRRRYPTMRSIRWKYRPNAGKERVGWFEAKSGWLEIRAGSSMVWYAWRAGFRVSSNAMEN